MIDYRVLVVALAFLAVLVWRFRPALSEEETPPRVVGLDTAKSDDERAELLASAGERFAARLGGARKAGACFARAMRLAPSSAELVRRAAKSLGRSPRVLEALLWRRLGAGPWVGAERDVARAAVGGLAELYDASSRTRPRARALEQVLEALGPGDAPPAEPKGDA